MTDKKKRQMSPNGFFNRLVKVQKKNQSAEGFLKQHREFILTGELFKITTPVLIKFDAGLADPKSTIEDLTQVVFDFIREEEQKEFLRQKEKIEAGEKKKNIYASVIARILDHNGNPVVMVKDGKELDSEKGFALGQDAERWVDRRLVFDAEPGCFGEIVHPRVILKGEPMKSVVSREESFARLHGGGKKGPVMKRTPRSVSRLTSVMRVKESRATFSGA